MRNGKPLMVIIIAILQELLLAMIQIHGILNSAGLLKMLEAIILFYLTRIVIVFLMIVTTQLVFSESN